MLVSHDDSSFCIRYMLDLIQCQNNLKVYLSKKLIDSISFRKHDRQCDANNRIYEWNNSKNSDMLNDWIVHCFSSKNERLNRQSNCKKQKLLIAIILSELKQHFRKYYSIHFFLFFLSKISNTVMIKKEICINWRKIQTRSVIFTSRNWSIISLNKCFEWSTLFQKKRNRKWSISIAEQKCWCKWFKTFKLWYVESKKFISCLVTIWKDSTLIWEWFENFKLW